MVQIEYLPIVLTGIGIIVSILYYTSVLRNAEKARKREMFLQLWRQTFNKDEMQGFWRLMNLKWEDYDDFMEKYGPEIDRGEEATIRIVKWNFYDGIGLLVKDGVVDLETVYSMMGRRIIMVWFKFETIIKGLQSMDEPGRDYMENFEYLANEMIRIRLEKGLKLPVDRLHPTSTLLEKYT